MILYTVHYIQFQALETPKAKINYLLKNKDYLESNYDIKVMNLIKSWDNVR